MSTTVTKHKRYVSATVDPPHGSEGLTLTIHPDRTEVARRRFRLALDGAYAIVCPDGHVHPMAVSEQSMQWVDPETDDPDHLDVLRAYDDRDGESARRLLDRMLAWALDGWSCPAPDTEE